jgi:hypothetical protein
MGLVAKSSSLPYLGEVRQQILSCFPIVCMCVSVYVRACVCMCVCVVRFVPIFLARNVLFSSMDG